VVAPISADKPLSADESRTSGENRAAGQVSRTVATENQAPASAPPRDNPDVDTATVERAAQLYRQANLASATEGSVATPEQAQQLASQISQQMTQQAEQAFQSQAGGVSIDLTAVLETAPA
jgi:hypothetical protein